MTDEIATVRRVLGPSFCAVSQDIDGRGWLLGATGIRYTDGSASVHCSYSFATKAEAEAKAAHLRGKMA